MIDKRSYTLKQNNQQLIEPPEPLKECPFCGGKANMWIRKAPYFSLGIQIECEKCLSSTYKYLFNCGKPDFILTDKEGKEQAIKQAINRWNSRI